MSARVPTLRLLLGALVAANAACGPYDNHGTAPRFLDRLCANDGACVTAGNCDRTSGISNDTIAFHCWGTGRIIFEVDRLGQSWPNFGVLLRSGASLACDGAPCDATRLGTGNVEWILLVPQPHVLVISGGAFDVLDMGPVASKP